MNPLGFFCRSKELARRLEAIRPRLYRMAYAWTRNPALADDLTQDTLAKALKKHGQLRDPSALDTWLFSILANTWRDHLRKDREVEDIENVLLLHERTPEVAHSEQQLIDKVRAAIMRLPDGQRLVVTLVDLEGFTYMEVAKILDIPIGTVMSRLCRAHNTLKQRLLRDFDYQPSSAPARFRRIK
jgi:RNA polymerase sigma-70 factor (ECF subfamily)